MPDGGRSAAVPAADDGEGAAWEYCDVGSRCAVDIPLLKAPDAPLLAQMDPEVPSAPRATRTPACLRASPASRRARQTSPPFAPAAGPSSAR